MRTISSEEKGCSAARQVQKSRASSSIESARASGIRNRNMNGRRRRCLCMIKGDTRSRQFLIPLSMMGSS